LLLIKGTPQDKRKFLDVLLSQTDNRYLNYAVIVKQLIEQKNLELKKESPNRNYLHSINEQLYPLLLYIQEKRKYFIEFVNEYIEEIYQYITEQSKSICLKYNSNIDVNFNFNNVLGDEINKRNAYYGVHRDTFKIFLDNLDAEDYASQGQQRLLILCLKILQVKYIIQETKEVPIFILDDVFSELDKEKIKRFLVYIQNLSCQTFITATEYTYKEDFISYYYLSSNGIKKET
jgi:DNA replication and repair protein RecF